ncbi:MAG: peptidoglycan-associated lipoprotein Pal [Betaproteobacteria bacterium]|nr:peptidoglycan-associated lipoprotein Pal [Betaproteobacteria bacterium]
MKQKQTKFRVFFAAIFAALIAGCSSTPSGPEQEGAPVESRGGTPGSGVAGVATVTAGGVDSRGLPAVLTDAKSILSKRSVYFDYDSFEVKAEYKDLVTAHAKFLADNRQFKMLIQGNTDERGSREYNLALGQKRADAIKKMLALLGAREEQLESVSLGEEKPKNEGQNEAAWAENRRGDMLYTGEF